MLNELGMLSIETTMIKRLDYMSLMDDFPKKISRYELHFNTNCSK